MFIEEVEIYNILGCKSVLLKFDNTHRSSVYVVQEKNDFSRSSVLTMAVQLLCSAKYAHSSFLRDPLFDNIRKGAVRMKFILPLSPGRDCLDAIRVQIPEEMYDSGAGGEDTNSDLDVYPSTSRAALKSRIASSQRGKRAKRLRRHLLADDEAVQKFLKINARRDFRNNPDEVVYSVNERREERCSLAAFHGRFYICLDYLLPTLENLDANFNGDWLELLTSDLNNKWNQRAQLNDPFERFVHLFLKYGYPKQHILVQIARARILTAEALDVLHKTYAIKILRDTRGIFEFITCGEHTVWFYVPHYGRYADAITDVMVEDLNFEFMKTYIQDNFTSKRQYFWTDAQIAIKDMLLIAFQLSMGFHCKQQILYLQNFKEISNYQTIQIASTAFFQKRGLSQQSWTSKNYLQRIIDICINSGTTAIIEYPGGIPLHPVNAYLIKTYKSVEGHTTLQIINGEEYTLDYFLECLTNGLRSSN